MYTWVQGFRPPFLNKKELYSIYSPSLIWFLTKLTRFVEYASRIFTEPSWTTHRGWPAQAPFIG